jgi:hypothetical protein
VISEVKAYRWFRITSPFSDGRLENHPMRALSPRSEHNGRRQDLGGPLFGDDRLYYRAAQNIGIERLSSSSIQPSSTISAGCTTAIVSFSSHGAAIPGAGDPARVVLLKEAVAKQLGLKLAL